MCKCVSRTLQKILWATNVKNTANNMDAEDLPVEAQPDVLHDTFDMYCRAGSRQKLQHRGHGPERLEVDEIEAGLPACVRAGAVLPFAPACCRAGLHLGVERGEGLHTDPDLADKAQHDAVAERKGAPSGRIEQGVAGVMMDLRRTCGIFAEHTSSAYKALAGAFLVEKKNKKLRVITDARPANAWMLPVMFVLFSLETLMHVIATLGAGRQEKWYVVSADLRHWFHQIHLPLRLRPWFIFMLVGGLLLCPVAVPMGWILAPFIAQSLTWTILLSSNERGAWTKALGGGAILGVDSELRDEDIRALGDRPPAWLPLRGGGGIFVIIDNVLVVTKDPQIAEYWERRINACMGRFGAKLKEISRQTLEPGSQMEFEFLGVIWQHNRRRVKLEEGERLPGHLVKGVWTGTHRELAEALGKLLWFHRVNESPWRGASMQQLRQLYTRATPPAGATWDTGLALTAEESASFAAHWVQRASNEWRDATVLAVEGDVVHAAVDAASDTRLVGGVIYGDNGRVARVVQDTHMHTQKEIAVAELMAIVWMVKMLKRDYPGAALFVLATDSLTAKSWVEKGCATTGDGNELLDALFAELGAKRIFLTHINTKVNVADAPSRNIGQIDAVCTLETWKQLSVAAWEARGVWMSTGGQAGGTRRQREEC